MTGFKRLGEEDEAEHLLALYGGGERGLASSLEVVTRQFGTIQARTQLLLTLATITLTITGFSGARIVEAGGPVARWGLAVGLVFVLLTVILLLVNLRVRWLTAVPGEPKAVLAEVLRYRNAKTGWYLLQITLLGIGLTSYVGAVIAYVVSVHRGGI
jgi:hypothetical protein